MASGGDAIPLVSILIPFYNCPYVARAIESALQQTYQQVEILVINDGSQRHLDLLEPYRNRITVLDKPNGGTASAMNVGLHHARGEYVSWLSSDDLYVSEKTAKQLQFMQEREAVISYTAFQPIDAQEAKLGEPERVQYPSKWEFLDALSQWCMINGCTVMAKREVLLAADGFREDLPYTHDHDLWLRLLPHHEFYYLDEPLVLYRRHANMGTRKHDLVIRKEHFVVKRMHHATLQRLIERERGEGKQTDWRRGG